MDIARALRLGAREVLERAPSKGIEFLIMIRLSRNVTFYVFLLRQILSCPTGMLANASGPTAVRDQCKLAFFKN
jgi:hypothetical protein